MGSINHNELKEQVKISYETKTPLFIWGTTGIGKSDTIRQSAIAIAKENGLEMSEKSNDMEKFGFLDIRISQLEPSDLRGLPVQDLSSNTTKWLIPNWLPRDENSKGILFFDELNLSPPSIQAVAYQLILDRRIGDYVLPKDWVIISAGNRAEDKCNVFEMSSALCNRFLHTELSIPDKDDWSEWALHNDVDGRILAFLQFKPSSLFKFNNKTKDKAFPTPRSWAFCSKLIKDRHDNMLIQRLVASAVGEATSIEFQAFLRLQNKINLTKILQKPELLKDIEEVDLKYVLLGTIAEQFKKDKTILSKCFPLCEFLEPEFAILLLRFLKAINTTYFKQVIIKDTLGKSLLTKYAEILA